MSSQSLPCEEANRPTPSAGRRLSWRRRFVTLFVLIALLGLIGGWIYHSLTRQWRIAAAIEARGGRLVVPGLTEYLEYPLARLTGFNAPHGALVALRGTEFDDAWLAGQDDLRDVTIRQLDILSTRLSRDAVMRILAYQDPIVVSVPGISLTDADAEVVGRLPDVGHVNLMQSDITDAGLAALRPQRLRVLNVAGTRITGTALQTAIAGSKLQSLVIDGRQFTPELAAAIAQVKSLNMRTLMGPDVSDAHVQQLEALPGLKHITLDQTSASDEALAALRKAQPGARIGVRGAAEASVKWRMDP
ncbi:MAG: hypothetical protein U0992_09290 [Planctomycetaceae bacterium]